MHKEIRLCTTIQLFTTGNDRCMYTHDNICTTMSYNCSLVIGAKQKTALQKSHNTYILDELINSKSHTC